MIIVRVGLARDQGLTQRGSSSVSRTQTSHGLQQAPDGFGANSLAIEITQFIESDGITSSSDSNVCPMEIELKAGSGTLANSYAEDIKN